MKFGPAELVLILAVVVILFGPTQIPKLTKMFGQSIKSFREGMGADKAENKADAKTESAAEARDDAAARPADETGDGKQ